MSTWPTAPLIRIDKGTCGDTDISDTTATLVDVNTPEHGYYLLDGPRAGQYIYEGYTDEKITASRPCTAVPTGELTALRDAFTGVELTNFQHAVIQKLSAHIPRMQPATKNDPLTPKIAFSEHGDDNRATATIETVPPSSTYDAP
jgi:hypothetical protein